MEESHLTRLIILHDSLRGTIFDSQSFLLFRYLGFSEHELQNNYTSNRTKNNSFKAVFQLFFSSIALTYCLKISSKVHGGYKGHTAFIWCSRVDPLDFTAVCKIITGTQRSSASPVGILAMPCCLPWSKLCAWKGIKSLKSPSLTISIRNK